MSCVDLYVRWACMSHWLQLSSGEKRATVSQESSAAQMAGGSGSGGAVGVSQAWGLGFDDITRKPKLVWSL